MRYFDGEQWTNHYHEPGKLPAIGSWLNTTFSVFGLHWRGAAALAVAIAFIGNAVVWFGIKAVVGDVAVVNEELVNGSGATVLAFVLVLLFAVFFQGFGWLALNRYMQRAHFQADPSVQEALGHGLRRLPRYLLFMVVLSVAGLIVLTILSIITAVAPALGVLLLLAGLVAAVWIGVKLAFLVTAIALAPTDQSPITLSAEVSRGRFWPVLGRLLLLVVGLWLATTLVTASLGSAGQFFDAEVFANSFTFTEDTVEVADFRFADLLPSSGWLLTVIVINSIVQAASNVISTSAFVRLYLDSGAPSEL